MKKLALVSLCCVMGAMSTANAGWFDNLFKKEAEPQTLSEACNSDEITSICPEIALGKQTLTGCLTENVKSLSKKCAKYVKKSIKENKDLVLNQKDDATSTVTKQVQTVKANAKAIGKELKDTTNTVKEIVKE